MRDSNILVVLCLFLFAAVFADDSSNGSRPRPNCLTRAEAHVLRDLWISFFTHIGDGGTIANNSLTDDFHLYSQSTNAVTYGVPLSAVDHPQYASKQAFIAGQIAATATQPYAAFDVVSWDYGCDTFTFRWSLAFQPVAIAGIDFVHVQVGSYLLERAYSEWDSKLFLQEIGCKFIGPACGYADCNICPATTKRNALG